MAESHVDHRLAEAFASVGRVESIYTFSAGDALSVFTIIDDDDEETYDQIYEQERAVIRQFVHLHFDFNVVARRGRSVTEIVGSAVPVWQRNANTPCLNNASI